MIKGTTLNRDFQIKKYSTSSCGVDIQPLATGGRDAHPTRLDNLFVGNPTVNRQ